MTTLTDFCYLGSNLNICRLYANPDAFNKYFIDRMQLYSLLKKKYPNRVEIYQEKYAEGVHKSLNEIENVFSNVLREIERQDYLHERVHKKRRIFGPVYCVDRTPPFQIDCFAFHITLLPLFIIDAYFRRQCIKWESAWLHVRFMTLSKETRNELVRIITEPFVKDRFDDGSLLVPFDKVPLPVIRRLTVANERFVRVPEEYHFEFMRCHFLNLVEKERQRCENLPVTLPFIDHITFKFLQNDYQLISKQTGLCDTDSGFQSMKEEFADMPLTLHNLDTKLFPPCMRAIVQELEETNHTHYTARKQLTIFLKNIGVSYEDALKFWQHYFLKDMSEENFNKEYLYHIRHCYGLVGSRLNYVQYNCSYLLEHAATLSGCAFQNWGEHELKQNINKWHTQDVLNVVDIEDIVAPHKEKNFTQACSTYCGKLYMSAAFEPIKNPCQYYYLAKSDTVSENKD